jgi:hypothetical protein
MEHNEMTNLCRQKEISTVLDRHFNTNNNDDTYNTNNIDNTDNTKTNPWENNTFINFINDYKSLWSFQDFKNKYLDEFFLEIKKINTFSNKPLGNYLLQILSKIDTIDNYDLILNILEESTLYNLSFNLYDIEELNKLNYKPVLLNNLINLKNKLYYSKENSDSTFNIEIIQKRILYYSQGLISSDFPFNSKNFIIAGGFVVNSLVGIISDYTDIDIYIFSDFENQSKELINYFNHKCNHKIHMTYNKSIINIYPIGYKINIQLIKIGGSPQKIISDFDLSYSQMMIINWNNLQMTFNAYKSILTGFFTINRKAVIRNYRIVKAYIKGFKLDTIEYSKSLIKKKQNYNDHLLLDEVKKLIKDINDYNPDDDIDHELLEELLYEYFPQNSQEYKIMTKSIHLEQHMIDMININELKSYLEKESNCTYLDLKDLEYISFENLKYYIEEENDYNFYPEMNNIELKSIVYNQKYYLYPLQVNIGDYYKIIKSLSKYYITSSVKVSDLKIIKGTKYLKIIFKPDPRTKTIIDNMDHKIESLYKQFIQYNNFDQNICYFQKNMDNETIVARVKYDSLPFSDTFKELNVNRLHKFKAFNLKQDDIIKIKLQINDMFIGNKLIMPGKNTFGYHINMEICINEINGNIKTYINP